MKFTRAFFLLLSFSFLCTACFEDQDDVRVAASTAEIQDFIYRGLDFTYLYKSDVPQLAEDAFADENAYTNFLQSYATPEALFDELIFQEEDRFSFLIEDYRVLEEALNGISLNNGMEFGLVQLQENGQIFGYVRYVIPNSSADQQGVKRGMLFNRVDGTTFTENNFNDLLSPNSYTIGLASFDGENLNDLPETITLTKQELTENPVYIAKTLDVESQQIGYLMYNGFTRTFDDDLNAAFADFKAQGISDLVVDLRYNSGGSIETSNDLASMITGQFQGDLFSTQVYNENFEDEELLFNTEVSSGGSINSLNLNRVYVLTTSSTASASELLISSLRPYIEVIQIGDVTTGKFQGSTTLYDSPDFSRNNVNIGHRYAMQPLILKSVNANGFTDYVDGLTPTIQQKEDFFNLGELGDPQEPLLQTAINTIIGGGRPFYSSSSVREFSELGNSDMSSPIYQRMYVDFKVQE
ncbi:S41 family peptidase [Mesonia aquimarina]|uniref:S41 family peptidase n=1 Tax=Mesonia aquimarina TaxID=1504967 RepID=UPI000EF62A0A|nr:S41 family peptidase [Mesonia aquimarina]